MKSLKSLLKIGGIFLIFSLFTMGTCWAGRVALKRLKVVVIPNKAVVATEASCQFEAEVFDERETRVEADIRWSVSPELGKINQNGFFQAGKRKGKGLIKAFAENRQGYGRGFALVIVDGLRKKLKVEVIPKRKILYKKEKFQFKAVVKDYRGRIVDAKIEWKVKGDIRKISSNGLFIAGDREGKGFVIVEAKYKGLTGKGLSYVTIKGERPPLDIKIIPKEVTVEQGKTCQFKVEILTSEGSNITYEVRWKVDPTSLGTITQDGLFTASYFNVPSMEGHVIVYVKTENGREAKAVADVTVVPAYLEIAVVPNPATVKVGEEIQFKAYYPIKIDKSNISRLQWRVEPEYLGTIDRYTGLFRAMSVGEGKVIAEIPNVAKGEAKLIVTSKELIVKINPAHAIVEMGKKQQFKIEIISPAKNIVYKTYWKVDSDSLGTITQTGLFTASYFNVPSIEGHVIAYIRTKDGIEAKGEAKLLIVSDK